MESAPLLSTPEQELAYLRAQVSRKEAELASRTPSAQVAPEERATIISEHISAHRAAPAEVLAPEYRMSGAAANSEAQKVLADLNLGEQARAIESLQKTMEEKGIKNALRVLEKLNDPSVADDFHRYLVHYIAAGLPVLGSDEKAPRFRALHMALYEIALPEPKNQEAQQGRMKTLKELISGMEQFYAGLLSVGEVTFGEPGYFVLELAVPADHPGLQFYAAVPISKQNLFEKQLLAIFPDAQLVPQPNDYSIFVSGNTSLASVARLTTSPALPLKDYTEFDYDPLNAIINAFAKIEHTGEGAALQIIIEPRGDRHVKHYRKILQALRKGEKRGAAFTTPETLLGEFGRMVARTLFSTKPRDVQKAKETETRQVEENKNYIEQVERKIASPIAGVTIRLVASSGNATTTNQVLGELENLDRFAHFQNKNLGLRAENRCLKN